MLARTRSVGLLEGAPWLAELRAAGSDVLGAAGCEEDAERAENGRGLARDVSFSSLDLGFDVVDTTRMQAGLPAGNPDVAIDTRMRHSHFSINQLVVDDLVELLCTGRRAAQRTSRLLGRGGLFHFLAPPP